MFLYPFSFLHKEFVKPVIDIRKIFSFFSLQFSLADSDQKIGFPSHPPPKRAAFSISKTPRSPS